METPARELADLPSDAGADDLFYDAELHRIYLIAGSGAIDVYEIDASKNVRASGVIPTSAGAKTGCWCRRSTPSMSEPLPPAASRPQILVYSTR